MKCLNPNCNATDHEPGAKFCHKCGTKLIEIDAIPIHIVEPPKPNPADASGREAIESTVHKEESPKSTPTDVPGREAIDLGLPSGTKWPSCNVGATKSEEYGGYYAWGETEEKSRYDWKTYKYGSSYGNCQNLGDNIAGTQYDVATAGTSISTMSAARATIGLRSRGGGTRTPTSLNSARARTGTIGPATKVGVFALFPDRCILSRCLCLCERMRSQPIRRDRILDIS